MPRDIIFPPLIHWRSLLKGIAGGGVLAGSLACGCGAIFQAILFILGFIMLLDGVMISWKGVSIIICLIAAVVSAALSVALSFAGLLPTYLAFLLLLAFLLYGRVVFKPILGAFGGRKKRRED